MTASAARGPLSLHASTMVLGEVGILVRGPSGAGKTRLVVALIEAGQRDGRFARLVADDRTLVSVHGSRHVARPHPAIAGRIERRGLGILRVEHEAAAVLGLVVDLDASPGPRLPEGADREASIAGLPLPRLAILAAMPAGEASSLVLAALAARGAPAGGSPFVLPSPPQCTK